MRTVKSFVFLIFLILYSGIELHAQDSIKNSRVLGIHVHRGFIIAHSKAIKDVSHSNPWGIEMDFNWHLKKQDAWKYCFCYPRVGFSLFYVNFDNPDVLGYSIATAAYAEPFINAEKRLNYSIRFGTGPVYLSDVYDSVTNPDNLFYSTYIAFLVYLNFSVNYKISPTLTLRGAFNYNHISNGGIKNPNKGLISQP